MALNIVTHTLAFTLTLLMLHYMIRMAGLNGPVTQRLRDAWAAFAFLSGWIWLGKLEHATDFIPGIDLAAALRPFGFIPEGLLCLTLLRLWLVVHPLYRKKGKV